MKEQKGLVQNLQEELQEQVATTDSPVHVASFDGLCLFLQSWKFSKDMEPLETALSTASKMSG